MKRTVLEADENSKIFGNVKSMFCEWLTVAKCCKPFFPDEDVLQFLSDVPFLPCSQTERNDPKDSEGVKASVH